MKLLIFEPNWLGDVIFTTPIFKAIKAQDKDSYLEVILPKRCSDVLRHNPFVDEIIEFDEKTSHRNLIEKVKFINQLRAKKYDKVILLHRSLSRTLLCALAGINQRAGYAYSKRAFILTEKIPIINKDKVHKQDYYLNLIEKIGIKVHDRSCQFYLSTKEKNWADKIINENAKDIKHLIALNLLTNWNPKNWSIDNFIKLVSILKDKLASVKFFLTSQKTDARFLPLLKKHRNLLVDLTGKTSLLELGGLYEKMHLVVSGDSGPLHLAAAVKTKYIGIYGPTDPFLTGVRNNTQGKIIFENDSCPTPCYIRDCDKEYICMSKVSPGKVSQAVLELL